MIIENIEFLKKHILNQYKLSPTREGVSIENDPFLVYRKTVKRLFRKPENYELYIEMYNRLAGVIYVEYKGCKVIRDWVLVVNNIEEFDERVKDDIRKFIGK